MNSNMFRSVLVLFTLIFVGCASHLPGDDVPRSCVPGEILDANDCDASCDDGTTHLVCDQSGTTGICAVKPGEVCESSPPAPCQNDPRFNEIGYACTPQGCPSGSGQLFCNGQSVVCVALAACVTPVTCFRDIDGDNVGGTQSMVFTTGVCGTGYVLVTGDCDDNDPGRQFVCAVPSTWYRDADGDGFGCRTAVASCLTMMSITQPSGYVSNTGDCDDTVYSTTNMCSSGTTWYRDADGDGFGCQTSVSASCQTTVSVTQPAGYVANSSDCDDAAYSATNVCIPACLPPNGGTLRFEIPQSIANACPNRAIIVFDNAGNPRVSTQNATFWQEHVSIAWQGYVRSQLLCNVTDFNALNGNVQNWWNYGSVFQSWPAVGSDLSNLGFVFTLNGAALTNDRVINVTGGQQAEGTLPACVNN